MDIRIATHYSDQPDFAALGYPPVMVVGEIYSDAAQTILDQGKIEAAAKQAAATPGTLMVFDIENPAFNIDIRKPCGGYAPFADGHGASIQANIQKHLQIVKWSRGVAPEVKLGFYGSFPFGDYWVPYHYDLAMDDFLPSTYNKAAIKSHAPEYLSGAAVWQAANQILQPIADAVDYVIPSLYTFYNDVDGWKRASKQILAAARAYGKPVLPFLWPQFHDKADAALAMTNIGPDFWLEQILLCDQYVGGYIVWGGNLPWKDQQWWFSMVEAQGKYWSLKSTYGRNW